VKKAKRHKVMKKYLSDKYEKKTTNLKELKNLGLDK